MGPFDRLAPPLAVLADPGPYSPVRRLSFSARGSRDVLDGTVTGFQWDLNGDEAFEYATGAHPEAGLRPVRRATPASQSV